MLTNCTPTDAYRGAGPARGDLRAGADRRRVRAPGRQGPGRGPSDEPASAVRRGHPGDLRAERGLGELRAAARQGARVGRSTTRSARSSRRGATAAMCCSSGIGLSTYIEMCGLAPSNILGALRYAAGGWDAATIECLPTGKVIVKTGTSPHGQGHETTWSQIVADGLGRDTRRHRGPARRHGDHAAGDGYLRVALAIGRRRGASFRDGEDQGEGAHDRRARA